MPSQAPMPRTARIEVVSYKGPEGEVHRYELRGVEPETDALLGDYETREEAQEAQRKYEEGDAV